MELYSNPLHLVQRDLVRSAVIELGGAGGSVVGHRRRLLQRSAVLEVGGDAGGPERVVPDPGLDPGRRCSTPDHGVGVPLRQR